MKTKKVRKAGMLFIFLLLGILAVPVGVARLKGTASVSIRSCSPINSNNFYSLSD